MSTEASAGPPGTGKEERGASAAQRGQVIGDSEIEWGSYRGDWEWESRGTLTYRLRVERLLLSGWNSLPWRGSGAARPVSGLAVVPAATHTNLTQSSSFSIASIAVSGIIILRELFIAKRRQPRLLLPNFCESFPEEKTYSPPWFL